MLTSFVSVDTETTGLDFEHDRIIEIAAVRFEGGKPAAEFEALISPGGRSLSPVARLITGLDPAQLDAAPPAAETLRAFLGFAGDAPLVAHNAEFDAHFIRRALEAEGLAPPPGPWLDSLLLSRIAWPAWDSHRLDSLAERLNVPREAEHRALPDARRAGFVFVVAQNFVRENVSGKAWNDLARLSAELPDWSLVFAGEGGDGAASSAAEGDRPASSPGGASAAARSTDEAEEADEAAEALASGRWLALETPAGADDHAAGLRAALQGAAAGQRVLLAVPDAFAWNALRLSAPESAGAGRASVPIQALAEPSGYPCRARLEALAANPARVPLEERAALLPLIAWADRNASGPVADGRGFSPERSRLLWSRVGCDAWADDPAARAARRAADAAGVILVTHAALCAHVKLEGALLPACDSVVVTGAHRFPEVAQSAAGAGRAASFFRLREALQLLRHSPEREAGVWIDLVGLVPHFQDARDGDPKDGTDWRDWAEKWFEPERQLQKLLQKAGRHAAKLRPQGDYRVRYTEPVALAFGVNPEPVLEALRENDAFLERCMEVVTSGAAAPSAGSAAQLSSGGFAALGGELRRIRERLRAFRADFEFLCDARDAETVYGFEDVSNPHKATLRATPLDMEPFGDALRGLFGAGAFLAPALFSGPSDSSGSSGSPGSPSSAGGREARAFLRAAGFTSPEHPWTTRRAADPLPPPRFLMAPFAPAPAAGEQAGPFAGFLTEAAQPFLERGGFVLVPSQTSLRALHAALKPLLPPGTPLWSQHLDGNRDAILRLYAAGRGGWVIATEGFAGLRDANGNGPALLVITRMPLPPPRDPLLEARGEILREQGKNARMELWHPAAVLRVKKEWSTLRSRGPGPRVIWLLDARAAAEGLGARLAGALGAEATMVRSVEELREKTTQQYNNTAIKAS